MSEPPTDADIQRLCEQLAALLDADEPGLFTWVDARNRAARALYDALGKKLRVQSSSEAVREFARAAQHGDAEHREWLKGAAEAFIHGGAKAVPRPERGSDR